MCCVSFWQVEVYIEHTEWSLRDQCQTETNYRSGYFSLIYHKPKWAAWTWRIDGSVQSINISFLFSFGSIQYLVTGGKNTLQKSIFFCYCKFYTNSHQKEIVEQSTIDSNLGSSYAKWNLTTIPSRQSCLVSVWFKNPIWDNFVFGSLCTFVSTVIRAVL